MATKAINVNQCAKCPWLVGVDPHDIPDGYCPTKHKALESTIARGLNICGDLNMMACHESTTGKERPCVGWLNNQLGPGNNIGLRMWYMQQVRAGKIKGKLNLRGEQHETFEDTLPEEAYPPPPVLMQ